MSTSNTHDICYWISYRGFHYTEMKILAGGGERGCHGDHGGHVGSCESRGPSIEAVNIHTTAEAASNSVEYRLECCVSIDRVGYIVSNALCLPISVSALSENAIILNQKVRRAEYNRL